MLDTRILLRLGTSPFLFGHDMTEVLHQFSRECALDVIDFWEPHTKTREYLTTDNPDLQRRSSIEAYKEAMRLTKKVWTLPNDQEWTDEILDLHAACDAAHLSSFVGGHINCTPEFKHSSVVTDAWACTWQTSRAASYHSKHGVQGAIEMEARHRHRLNVMITEFISKRLCKNTGEKVLI